MLPPTRVLPAEANVGTASTDRGLLWIYALPNPKSDVPLRRVVCHPRDERSAIYALALTDVVEHPLRPGVRRKLRLPLPDGVKLNAIGEVDEADIGIDLGVVISARAALDYDHERWAGDEAVVQPMRLGDGGDRRVCRTPAGSALPGRARCMSSADATARCVRLRQLSGR